MDCSTAGMLYPGEMGASFAQLLLARGVRVVTTLQGRGERTARLARECRVSVLDSLEQVVRQSDLVFSFVSTSAATECADAYCALAHLSPPHALYVDGNSVGPETARALADKLSHAGRDFVDASVNGLAKTISTGGTLFLSGARSGEVAELVGVGMRVRLLGAEPGRASAMKMLLGGLSKGLCGLFLELASMAERRDMLPEMLDACATIYPGMAEVIERMLPTYARHAGRRAAELRELEQTAWNSGMQPCLIEALSDLHQQLAAVPFDADDGANVISLVKRIVDDGILAVDSPSARHEPTAV